MDRTDLFLIMNFIACERKENTRGTQANTVSYFFRS